MSAHIYIYTYIYIHIPFIIILLLLFRANMSQKSIYNISPMYRFRNHGTYHISHEGNYCGRRPSLDRTKERLPCAAVAALGAEFDR